MKIQCYQNLWGAVKIGQDHRSIIEASTLRTALLNFQMYVILLSFVSLLQYMVCREHILCNLRMMIFFEMCVMTQLTCKYVVNLYVFENNIYFYWIICLLDQVH